jgi:hypothetical protein
MAAVRIQPRHQILDVWQAILACSYRDGVWTWGGRDESNSISDAEQLLCLLYPATEIDSLSIDRADAVGADVRRALKPLGEIGQLPRTVLGIAEEYVRKYTDEDQEPIFDSGRYVSAGPRAMTAEQSGLQLVDAYSMSVSLCLATLGFLQVYGQSARRSDSERIDFVRDGMRRRLTAAMVGLLRSFVVNTTAPDGQAGQAILGTVNTTGAPEQQVFERLRRQLTRVRAVLRDDARIGLSPDMRSRLEDESQLFECGWTWGISSEARPIDIDFVKGVPLNESQGYAVPRPYLYFTVVALDGINDLRSERTRELGLLDENQRRLADALEIRWAMTQRYWSTVARFGDRKWPLENIPWRTSDDEESEYFSLLVSAVLVQDLQARRATDDDLTRAVQIFEELAGRGRITSRVTAGDKAVELHLPGVRLTLGGADVLGPPLYRHVADFAPLLLKRSLQAAGLSQNVQARDRLMAVAEFTMEHLHKRRLRSGQSAAVGLWDDPREALSLDGASGVDQRPSWYITERVVEGLVAAAKVFQGSPLRNGEQVDRARLLIAEAEHLLNTELMDADADDESVMRTGLGEIESRLGRAREILSERPGTAAALAMAALRDLDQIAVAHGDATRSM